MDIRHDTNLENSMKNSKHKIKHDDQEQRIAAKENPQNQDSNMLLDSGSGLSGDTTNAERSSRDSSEGTSGASLAASYASLADMMSYDSGVMAKSASDDSEMIIGERKENPLSNLLQVKSSPSLAKQSKLTEKKLNNKNLPKKYFCRVCNQGFTRKHNMVSHELIHSESKPHVCTVCDLKFRRIHDLRRHEKLHTGEKPFICKKCKRSFARPDALTRHQNSPNACSGSSANKSGLSGSATAVSSSGSSNESDGSNNNVSSSMSITDIINRDNFDDNNNREYGYESLKQNQIVPRRREMSQSRNRENMYYNAESPYHRKSLHQSPHQSPHQEHLVFGRDDPLNSLRHQTYQTVQNKPYNTTITTTTTTTTTTNRRNFNPENVYRHDNNSDNEHLDSEVNRSSLHDLNSKDESFGRRRLNEGKYVTMERYQDLVSYTQDLKKSLKSMSSRLQLLESESSGRRQTKDSEN